MFIDELHTVVGARRKRDRCGEYAQTGAGAWRAALCVGNRAGRIPQVHRGGRGAGEVLNPVSTWIRFPSNFLLWPPSVSDSPGLEVSEGEKNRLVTSLSECYEPK